MTVSAARRLEAIDAARGLAVLAMFVFHFTWDLGHFGYIDASFPYSRGFELFGHTIAFSFLFIAGVCLALAHENGVRWSSFWRRLTIISGAACLVSIGTWAVFPSAFVFFGVLHCIVASSLLAAPFLFVPWPAALVAAAAAAIAPHLMQTSFFDAPQWWWTGLSTFEPLTNDYRPLAPWAGAMLVGVGATKAWQRRAGLPLPVHGEREFGGASRAATRALTFFGRHSLLLYLAHQPLFFASFTAMALLAQPPVVQEMQSFQNACETQCAASGGQADTCRAACACTAEKVSERNALANVADEAERQRRVSEIARECMGKEK